MKPVFADTFYWIALTSPTEAAYERANQVTDDIVTIDEVLTEYLTFFSAASEYVRRKTAKNVQQILLDPGVYVIPQTRESFLSGLDLYASRPGQKLQPHRLYFHADHATRRFDRRIDQRQAF